MRRRIALFFLLLIFLAGCLISLFPVINELLYREKMKTGDIFYLHVLGETLAYEVDSLNTVLPHDTSLLGITDGSDLCTLITCTPIAVNSHRLLVTGHRIPFEAAKEIVEEAQQEDTEVESAWEQEYLRGLYIALAIVLILFLICIVVALLGRNKDA